MKREETNYIFNPKRNHKLITPCCNKDNKNGKFINYKNLPTHYGYCHSCGTTTLPPKIYLDENGKRYTWNGTTNKYEPINYELEMVKTAETVKSNKSKKEETVIQKYISEETIWNYYSNKPENNLLQYIRKTYRNHNVDDVFENYVLGTTKDGGVIFWQINKNNQIQKGKISYYNKNGKRNNKFNAPYKNKNGYFSCLFGEHLIIDNKKGIDTLILVESEKTAIIGAILLPEFVWLSYSGRNGLTKSKYNCLIGHKILIIPDMSETDVKITNQKVEELNKIGVKANIWDMTNGRTNAQLKKDSDYNCDLEDVFRQLINN